MTPELLDQARRLNNDIHYLDNFAEALKNARDTPDITRFLIELMKDYPNAALDYMKVGLFQVCVTALKSVEDDLAALRKKFEVLK